MLSLAWIDLSRFSSSSCSKSSSQPVHHPDDWTYDLCGVIVHTGPSRPNGHYVAYVFQTQSNKWYLCDDESVTMTRPEVVAQQQAYVLLYRRKQQQVDTSEKDANRDENSNSLLAHLHGSAHTLRQEPTCLISSYWLKKYELLRSRSWYGLKCQCVV